MKYIITENGKVVENLTYSQFVDFYFAKFGYDCGSPSAVVNGLVVDQSSYLGRGFTVTAVKSDEKEISYCRHANKYTQKFQTFTFDYCPDCKKEV